MQHYCHMIKSHGTADNFNTELPERLHIDIAKDTFKHTNKKNYIAQMHQRLKRQEAVRKFTAYLLWAVEGYVPGGKKAAQANPLHLEEQPEEFNEPDDCPDPPETPLTTGTSLQHHIARNPPFVMGLDEIESTLNIHRFSGDLKKFLIASGSLHPALGLAIEDAWYPVFKQFTIGIPSPPQVSSERFIWDVIQAKADEPGSTVLAKPGTSADEDASIDWWDIRGEFERNVQLTV